MKSTAAIALLLSLLGIATATTVQGNFHSGPKLHRVSYDYDDIEDQEERCLCNEINQQGRKIVLVNLDDKCVLKRFEREGIFVQTGDLVVVMGSAIAGSG